MVNFSEKKDSILFPVSFYCASVLDEGFNDQADMIPEMEPHELIQHENFWKQTWELCFNARRELA